MASKPPIKCALIVGGAAVAALVLSCAPPSFDPSHLAAVGSSASPVTPGEWPNVVALTDGGHLACSGVLVAPTIVLTAAHCLPGSVDPRSLKVYRGDGNASDRLDGGIAVARGARHPDYPASVWGWSDIAYLVLEEPQTDLALTPVGMSPEDADNALSPGKTALVLGFGVHDNGTKAMGVKYSAAAPIKFRSGHEIVMGDAHGDGCDGDSGGPAFARLPEGAWRLVGITSRGPTPCGSAAFAGTWTLVTPFLCWLTAETGWTPDGETCLPSEPSPVAVTNIPFDVSTSDGLLCSLASESAGGAAAVRTMKVAMLRAHGTFQSPDEVSCDEVQSWAKDVLRVDLSKTGLVDPRPLAALAAVQDLNLEDNGLTSLGAAPALSSLKILRIGWNSLGALGDLDEAERRGVAVFGRGLQSPGWRLSRGTAFVHACLAAAATTAEPAVASNMKALREAACLGSDCSCYTAGDELQRNRMLNLAHSAVTDLTPLREVSNLQVLDLSGTKVRDLTPVANLENLRQLIIPGFTGDDQAVRERAKDGYLSVFDAGF